MLCISIVGPSYEEALEQIDAAQPFGDLLEFRLDLFKERAFEKMASLRRYVKLPLIFTLRKLSQGGKFDSSEENRFLEIDALASLTPDYFDLEYDIPSSFLERLKVKFPLIQWIVSFHDFYSTPINLDPIVKEMQLKRGSLYKIACMAHSSLDTLRLIHFSKAHPNFMAISMGKAGQFGRVLTALRHDAWSYASLNAYYSSAPGQMPAEEMIATYGVDQLNEATQWYGLIGNPVAYSPSHVTHNRIMQELGLNGIYVKMDLNHHELPAFLTIAKQIGWSGLSVTMPFKETVIPYLDQIDLEAQTIGAVNTLTFKDGRITGYNTDGKGALDAIESHIPVKGQKIAVLGAGGSARAIIFEALKRGAEVKLFNRSHEKGARLASHFGIEHGPLHEIKPPFHILINTIPHPMPIDPSCLMPDTWVMDINLNSIIEQARRRGCHLVYGYEMFIHQAIGQFEFWFRDHFPLNWNSLKMKELFYKILPENYRTLSHDN